LDRKKIVSSVLLLLVVVAVLYAIIGANRIIRPRAIRSGSYVAAIYLEGVIVGGRAQHSLLQAAGGTDTVIRQLREAAENPDVAAVVLRINSPGGTAAASQEVYQEALRFKESGKPLVASFSDVAASGGYWVACAADRIVANAASITGSIGVIMEVTNLQELFRMLGMDREVIKSGEHKDIGSALRPMTEEERTILQAMVDDIFEQFVTVVAEGRNLDSERVRELADGRVFTGRQAQELGLVDQLGDFYAAAGLAAEMAGLPDRPRIREMGRRSPFSLFWGGAAADFFPSAWPLRMLPLLPR
jgi:protease-4